MNQPKRYQVDISTSPDERWSHIINEYKTLILATIDDIDSKHNKLFKTLMTCYCYILNSENLPFYHELQSIAKILSVSLNKIIQLQLFFESNCNCTSIISQNKDGHPFIIRSLDSSLSTLIPITIEVDFIKDGEIKYTGTTWAGFVGLLTGMIPGKLGIAINSRSTNMIKNLWEKGLTFKWPISFLVRHTLESYSNTFNQIIILFNTSRVLSSCYIILCGCKKGEIKIIIRDKNNENILEKIPIRSLENNKFLVQTNCDYWITDLDSPNNINKSIERRIFVHYWIKQHYPNQYLNIEDLWEMMKEDNILNEQTTYLTALCPKTKYYKGLTKSLIKIISNS